MGIPVLAHFADARTANMYPVTASEDTLADIMRVAVQC